MQKVSVFCGSSMGSDPYYQNKAVELANYLLEHNMDLVYGGASIGIMTVLADTMLQKDGVAIGVMPKALIDKEITHKGLTELHVVESMSARKDLIVKLSDAFVAFPGGMGTLDELSEILTLNQIRVEGKPVGILNLKGYFDPILDFVDNAVKEGFMREEHQKNLIVSDSIPELFEKMKAYQPLSMKKWIEDIKTESKNR